MPAKNLSPRRTRRCTGELCEEPVKHEINDDAGYRYGEPQRESPASDGSMPIKSLAQGAAESDENHRHDHNRQNRMRGQNREIQRSRPTRSSKVDDASMVGPV